MPLLREKISILALMELVFNKPSEGRSLPFSEIAKVTRLKEDEVELLVMKALSLKLIRGEIDEVRRIVSISWVQVCFPSFLIITYSLSFSREFSM